MHKISPKQLTAEQFFEGTLQHHIEYMKEQKQPEPSWLVTFNKQKEEINFHVIKVTNMSPVETLKYLIMNNNPDYYIAFLEGYAVSIKEVKNFYDFNLSGEKRNILAVVGRSKDGKHQMIKSFNVIKNKNNEVVKVEEDKEFQFEPSKKFP